MAFCTQCGSEIEDDAATCPACGHTPGEEAPEGEAEEEEGRRSRQAPGRAGLIVLGALLLIATLLPLYDGSSITMTNVIELSSQPEVPSIYKLLGVYPLPAGLAVIVLAFALKGLVRSLPVIALGLFPLVAFFLTMARGIIVPSGATPLLLGGVLPTVAVVLIFAGSRARRYRPSSLLGALVGAAGGVLYIVAMVLPILPKELGRVPIVGPVMAIIAERSGAQHVATIARAGLDLLAKVLFIGASIVLLVTVAPRPVMGLRAQAGVRAWTWGVVFLFLTLLVPAVASTYTAFDSGTAIDEALLNTTLPALSPIAKTALAALGLFLLVPVGLAHLVVHLSPAEPGPLPGYAETAGGALAQAGPAGLEARLKTLKQMLDDGLISQEEFDEKRQQILSQM